MDGLQVGETIKIIEELVTNVTTVAADQFADPEQARADFLEYNKIRNLQEQELTVEQEQKKAGLRQKVINMMSLDITSAQRLGYTGEMAEVNATQAALQTDAMRSGVDKIANDFMGRKRSAAKKKLATDDAYRKKTKFKHMQKEADARLEEGERSYAVGEKDEQLEEGRNSYRLFQRTSNNIVIGPRKMRRKEYTEQERERYAQNEFVVTEPVQINTKDGVLAGKMHRPIVEPTGKLIIFYSGNTNTNERQSGASIKQHLANGASVLCVDYRGFGDSISTDKQGERVGTQLVEDGMYRDSLAIYDYAKEQVKSTSDIILYGYSLGGSMASRVAAHVSLANAKKQAKGKVSENDRLGGIIIQSPINSTYNAGRLFASSPEKYKANDTGWFANMQGKFANRASGRFSTEEHLQVVAKYDPNIPAIFLSGRSVNEKRFDNQAQKDLSGDFLSLQDTEVDVRSGLTNRATYIGEHDHGNVAYFADINDASKNSSDKLSALIKFGRATDMVADKQTEPKNITGLQNEGPYKLSDPVVQAGYNNYLQKHGNPLTETVQSEPFLKFCNDNSSFVVKEGVAGLNIPETTTTPAQLRDILLSSKQYTTCVSLMTYIGTDMLQADAVKQDAAELIADLNKPMDVGAQEANLQNVIMLQGRLGEQCCSYFMKNEKVLELYKQVEGELRTIPFFAGQQEMMGHALGLLFTNLILEYADKLKVSEKDKTTPLAAIAPRKSLLTIGKFSKYTQKDMGNYLSPKALTSTAAAVSDGAAGFITKELQSEQEKG